MDKNNTLTVPMAIVVAGLLIAGAVFLSGKGSSAPIANGNDNQAAVALSRDMNIKPASAGEHLRGNPDAPIILVEYSDTECPFCKRFHATLGEMMNEYGKNGKVAWAYRHFPLDQIHSKARKEAEATECAASLGGNDKFWQYLDRLYEITPANNGLDLAELPKIATQTGLNSSEFKTCLDSGRFAGKVEENYQDGVTGGVRGTPGNFVISKTAISEETQNKVLALASQYPPETVVWSNDGKIVFLNGALPYSFIKGALDLMLAEAK